MRKLKSTQKNFTTRNKDILSFIDIHKYMGNGTTRDAVLEKLQQAKIKFFTNKTPPFDKNPLGKYLKQTKPLLNGKKYEACAVISNAGFLRGRKLGAFIGIKSIITSN